MVPDTLSVLLTVVGIEASLSNVTVILGGLLMYFWGGCYRNSGEGEAVTAII